MMKIAKMLLKITHLKSRETLMYQGLKTLFILFLLLLLLNIYINKKYKYIYILLGALMLKLGNISNTSASIPCGSKVERCYFLVTHADFGRFSVTLFSSF